MRITEQSLKVLQECVEEKVPVIFSGDALDIVFQTVIFELNNDCVALANKVPAQYISKVMQSKSFGLQCKMLRFTTPKIMSDGENIVFTLSELNQLEETRQAERFPFQSEERVICKILNPFDEKTILVKSVLDMSATGVSIRCPRHSKLFQPGVKFSDLRVIIDGEQYNKTAASVVYTRKLMDMNARLRVQVGLKFET